MSFFTRGARPKEQLQLPLNDPEKLVPLYPGATFLRGVALSAQYVLWEQLKSLLHQCPPRIMETPGGPLSVATSSCGSVGWVSSRNGYQYCSNDPTTGLSWPAMPISFLALANEAATLAGFTSFSPDTCLINLYSPGSKLSLHQDKEERDPKHPIVSVSLGLPALFRMGGFERSSRTKTLMLSHGDVVVWGGPSRMRFHGVLPIAPGCHFLFGETRVNLTFRQAR